MQKVGKFKITDSFKITDRGLVAIGDIIEGRVRVGNNITFNTGTQDVTMKIAGVEMGDRISENEYFVGLLFVYKNNEQLKEFEDLKLQEQIADIWEVSDWRLMNQEKYLLGARLFYRNYADRKTRTNHDHCEFCMEKFSDSIEACLTKGYTTKDSHQWICDTCFADFKERFKFEVSV